MKKDKGGDSYDQFVDRHIGPDQGEITQMLQTIGLNSIEELINFSVPKSIRSKKKLNILKRSPFMSICFDSQNKWMELSNDTHHY